MVGWIANEPIPLSCTHFSHNDYTELYTKVSQKFCCPTCTYKQSFTVANWGPTLFDPVAEVWACSRPLCVFRTGYQATVATTAGVSEIEDLLSKPFNCVSWEIKRTWRLSRRSLQRYKWLHRFSICRKFHCSRVMCMSANIVVNIPGSMFTDFSSTCILLMNTYQDMTGIVYNVHVYVLLQCTLISMWCCCCFQYRTCRFWVTSRLLQDQHSKGEARAVILWKLSPPVCSSVQRPQAFVSEPVKWVWSRGMILGVIWSDCLKLYAPFSW